jgi:CRISPR-associated protein Cas2
MKRNFLVGYDISDPKRLRKVANVISGFGARVQYSFFHCHLSQKQIEKMKKMLKKEIKEEEDQIIILPVTEKQLQEIEFLGYKVNLEAEGIIIV